MNKLLRRINKQIWKRWLRLTGQVEIRHWLEWNDTHGRHVISHKEVVPGEEMRSIDPQNIMKKYHIPWERQQRSIYDAYLTWNDNSYWEVVE